jgi:hypothetical protein
MAKPTAQDAQILLQLATWYTDSDVGGAINWARGNSLPTDYADFDERYPNGSEGRLLVNRILGFYETVGTLWKNRLINEDLLFDWLWIPASWDLVKGIALGMRGELVNAGLWENFEAMSVREEAVEAATAAKARPAKAKATTTKNRTAPTKATRKGTKKR